MDKELVGAAKAAHESKMRAVSHQVEAPERGRKSFDYLPDRHYVLIEAPSANWDGSVLDTLLDMLDPETGDFAYRIEARGDDKAGEGRRVTGHRHKVLLSCSKEFADRSARKTATDSSMVARLVSKGEQPVRSLGHDVLMSESLQEQRSVPLRGVIGV